MPVRVRLRGIGHVGFNIERKLVGMKFSYICTLFHDAFDPFYSHDI